MTDAQRKALRYLAGNQPHRVTSSDLGRASVKKTRPRRNYVLNGASTGKALERRGWAGSYTHEFGWPGHAKCVWFITKEGRAALKKEEEGV